MEMISVFAMTNKGFEIISKIIGEFGASFISVVISAKDNNIENDYYGEIEQLCLKNNIPFSEKNGKYEINTEYSFAISWRWLIKLDKEKKLIVFHDSLLPKYRGFAPLVNSLINGNKQIGVTAIFASEEYDKGKIIFQSGLNIKYPIKIKTAIELNNKNYWKTCLHVCNLISKNKVIKISSQNENNATYSLWRDEEDYNIDWNKSSKDIKRFIDATGFPYKFAAAFINNKKIRIAEAEVIKDVKIINRDVGKVININNGLPVIACGKGLLMITEAFYDDSKIDLLPIKKFRTRFK